MEANHKCQRCGKPRADWRAVSDAMDMRICVVCAAESFRYAGPLGHITIKRLEEVHDRSASNPLSN